MLVFPLSRQNAFDVFLDSQIHFLKGRLFYILTYPEFELPKIIGIRQ